MEHMYNTNTYGQEQGWVTVGMPWGGKQQGQQGQQGGKWGQQQQQQPQPQWGQEQQWGQQQQPCCSKQPCYDEQCKGKKMVGQKPHWGGEYYQQHQQHQQMTKGFGQMGISGGVKYPGFNGGKYECEKSDKCCDEDMVKAVKELIVMQFGAEQSYNQLGRLCASDKLNWWNCAEYFRLCGMRMRFLATGMLKHSEKVFGFHDLIAEMPNNTIGNLFRVPGKDELPTTGGADFQVVLKQFFQMSLDCEQLVEKKLAELTTMINTKIDWANVETGCCKFEGFKWFTSFVMPFQMRMTRDVMNHFKALTMCECPLMFDKVEMFQVVKSVEQYIYELPVSGNGPHGGNNNNQDTCKCCNNWQPRV